MTNSTRRWGVVRVFAGFTGKMILLACRTSERKRKALLIGINYGLQLRYPQRDTKEMCALLKEKFEFLDEDIIILTDDAEAGPSLQPTRDNIMREVGQFIIPGQDNTDYVLFYSGHSDQHDDLDGDKSVEEDGKKEYIIPVDPKKDAKGVELPESVIYDTFLHEKIIAPLNDRKGCHLFAVFDSCHSATLLNLRHHRCNRVGTLTSAARRGVRRFVVEDVREPIRKRFFLETGTQPHKVEVSLPGCSGFCPRVPNRSRKSTVICVSACKDSELTLEHETSVTLALAIINLLKAKPKASIKDVMYTAIDVAKTVQHAAKLEAKRCWGMWKYVPFRNIFISAPEASPVRLALAKWNPQLSSNEPLDINATLLYSDMRNQKVDSRGRVKGSLRDRLGRLNPFRAYTLYPQLPAPYCRDSK